MRNICVITGTRAEYGLLKPVMEAIENHPRLHLNLIATGMHLSDQFGKSINEIIDDGFSIDAKIHMNPEADTNASMAISIGIGISEMANVLLKMNPNFVLILGDRIEAFAGAVAAAFMNIPVAHIHGGDSARAGLDESVRHAITKFAHIHFPATRKSADRILKMGEDSWRIFVVGAPALDTILNKKLLSKQEIKKKFEIDFNKPLIILLQHSVTTEPEDAKQQITETLEAIKYFKLQTIILYPNSDAGGRIIIEQINSCKTLSFIKIYKNLSHIHFLSLMKYASVMVGNSSSGIIESPSFKLPVVNIGIRQEGRERSVNVIDVPHFKEDIIKAINKALFDKEFRETVNKCQNPYGEGKASERIVDILDKIVIDKKLIQKKLTY